ncbi:Abc transporter c family member 5, partial [Globisporangium splendens]
MSRSRRLLAHTRGNTGYASLADTSACKEHPRRPHPVNDASFVSRMLFSFVSPLFQIGNERQLNLSDLYELEEENVTATAYAKFKTQFDRHNGSIAMAMVATNGLPFVWCGFGALFSAACAVFAPQVLHHVVDAFAAPEIDGDDVTLWLGMFFVARVANAIVAAQTGFYLEIFALRLTQALKSLLFQKSIRRSLTQSKKPKDVVDISNLYTSDVANVLSAATQINSLWVMPLQVVVAMYLLYDVIGLVAFAGVGVIGVTTLASFLIATLTGRAFKDIMARKDERMKTVKEVFGAIQIVKFNAWEPQFAKKIDALRTLELQAVAKYLFWNSTSIFLLWTSPIFVSTISFGIYSLVMDQTLTAAKVFTAIALFNAIRDPLRDLPIVVQTCIQAQVSLKRMGEFLELDEFDSANVTRDDPQQPRDVVVAVGNGSFGWTTETPILKNVNLQVKKGDLVVVHGMVGAGKSSLCSALLGEMEKTSGSVFVRGRVAYYSQQAWIQNATIRDNILFGNSYDHQRYQKVLDACGLEPDIAQFPGGDATEIGQKGVNLSGGQRARVCLARACYSDADVFILDSPLAAVDAVVQSEIFGKCICGLLEHKTIILVTHSPDIIASEAANYRILLEDGELSGDRKDTVMPRHFFAPKLSQQEVKQAREQKEPEQPTAKMAQAGKLVDDEEREKGRVAKSVFLQYFQAAGGLNVCLFLIVVQVLWQSFQVGSDLWLSHWTGTQLGAYNEVETQYNMTIYSLLGAGSVVMVLVRTLTIAFVGLRAARQLFEMMTHALLHAPLRFFDANPIGRIVNRYSDDVSMVDFNLPFTFGSVLGGFFFTVFQLATAMYTVSYLGVMVVPFVCIYVKVANFYLAPSREISRLWKVVGSPVLSHVAETEEGVTQIRAFGPEYVQRALATNFERIDLSSKVWYVLAVGRQWFQLRMHLLGCGVVILVLSSLMYLHSYMSPGLVGLSFSYALSVDGRFARLVQVWSWIEMFMVSPERILEYAEIPAEGTEKVLVLEPSCKWPEQGSIKFEDVVFSYKEGAPAVLKGVSFDIKSNEKIGIVGRTGAGKSSLTMALFRFNELDAGRILIDDKDISTMPLRSLRSKLSIIPQAPVLFKGPLRAYMDPFDEFTDAEIWSVFEKVEMKAQITALENQLSYELSEDGDNFSVGERQMLYMARALLTQTRIVVMDEATASIDHATEKKLQTLIERDFRNTTVLTIAHRLATVLGSDRIMVLRDGQVVEFDTPKNLAENAEGAFYELAKEGGYLNSLLHKL